MIPPTPEVDVEPEPEVEEQREEQPRQEFSNTEQLAVNEQLEQTAVRGVRYITNVNQCSALASWAVQTRPFPRIKLLLGLYFWEWRSSIDG